MKLLKWLCFFICFWGAERFSHRQTDGFQLTHITTHHFVSGEEGAGRELVEPLLAQPFTYLSSGGQTYAFLSADGTCVLKLFKHHHLRSRKKREAFFRSCKLASEELKEETGLLYLQLHRSTCWKKPVVIVDKLGIAHLLDLNQHQFALQKRASLASRQIKKLMRAGKREEAKERLAALLEMLAARSRKGIRDRDSGLRRNIGIVGKKAISIDIGSFSKEPALQTPEGMELELKQKTSRLARFLERYDFELWQFYKDKLQQEVER